MMVALAWVAQRNDGLQHLPARMLSVSPFDRQHRTPLSWRWVPGARSGRPKTEEVRVLFQRMGEETRIGGHPVSTVSFRNPASSSPSADTMTLGRRKEKLMRLPREWLFWAVLIICPAAGAQNAVPDLRGIYVYTTDIAQLTNNEATTLSASFGVPGVDGVAVTIGWAALEPARGQFQWATLDQWMGMAFAAGKKIDLVIPAGDRTPSWLFDPAPAGGGARPLTFTVSNQAKGNGVCKSETVATPWDPAFIAEWDVMLAAVAAHLKSAGTYNALTLLRLTGINEMTEELRLPVETPQSTGLSCVTNSISLWQQAGYRPSLLLQGWSSILGSFQKSFPDKSFSLALIPFVAFPGIAENGSLINGTVPDRNQPLLQLASQKLPGRLVIQFDSLLPGQPPEQEVIQAAQTLGTLAAYQTNEDLGGTGQGAGCSPAPNPTPCTNATFLQMLETGIYPSGKNDPLRSQYIEVFHGNVNAFPAAVLQAHYELLPFNSRNSASYSTAPLAPDMIAFGEAPSVAGGLVIAPDGPWPPTLGGARLDITDSNGQTRSAPLYFVTATQLGYLIPSGTSLGQASLKLTTSIGTTVTDRFQVDRVSPGVFTANGSGSGVGAGFWIRVAANGAQTQGYLFDPSQPAGSRKPVPVDLGASTDRIYLSLYGTGFRGATQATATVGGGAVPVLGFAAVIAYQGEDIINIGPLPRSLAGQGEVTVAVSFDGKPANSVTVSIH